MMSEPTASAEKDETTPGNKEPANLLPPLVGSAINATGKAVEACETYTLETSHRRRRLARSRPNLPYPKG